MYQVCYNMIKNLIVQYNNIIILCVEKILLQAYYYLAVSFYVKIHYHSIRRLD